MRERYIPAIIMLLAGAITSMINIINKVSVLTGLKRLLIALLVFYLIGVIIKLVISKMIIHAKEEFAPDEKTEEDAEEQNEESSQVESNQM